MLRTVGNNLGEDIEDSYNTFLIINITLKNCRNVGWWHGVQYQACSTDNTILMLSEKEESTTFSSEFNKADSDKRFLLKSEIWVRFPDYCFSHVSWGKSYTPSGSQFFSNKGNIFSFAQSFSQDVCKNQMIKHLNWTVL